MIVSIKISLKIWIVLAICLILLYSLYNSFYSNHIKPGVHFVDLDLSNKGLTEAEILVNEKIQEFQNRPVTFFYEGSFFDSTLESLGISIDKKATFDAIKKEKGTRSMSLSLFSRRHVVPKYTFDTSRLLGELEALFGQSETQAKDATVVFQAGHFLVEEEESGSQINRNKLVGQLSDKVENLTSGAIEVAKISVAPKVDAQGAEPALSQVKIIAGKRIILTFGTDRWEIASQKLIDFLKFEPEGLRDGVVAKFTFGPAPLEIRSLATSKSKTKKLEVALDKTKIEVFVSQIAKRIDSPRVDATIKFEGDKVVDFTPARDGQKLDVVKTYDLILDQISTGNIQTQKDITIALPVAVNPAKIASSEINSLGIQELIGRGVSYFSGSIPNRIHNINLGAKRVSGKLIKPDEVFSFNQTVGEVSAATGYKQAYVISQGRTVLDDGGGICQVSTTVFRAALNAGLPVVARVAHAYRVGYYEQAGFKPGLDATVWAPAVDFKFKNDTANHILIQAIFDPAAAKLQVDIYGTGDNRKVEIGDSIISNLKPPPADKHQEDPTLPRGIVKQVDFAATGATVIFTRKVYRDGTILIDESFKSNYRPWQAVYLVGTGG